MKKLVLKIVATIFLTLSLAGSVSAANGIPPSYNPNPPNEVKENIKYENVTGVAHATILLLEVLAGGLLYFAAPLGVLMLIVAGLNMIIGSNDPEKIDQSKKHITWTIIGLLIIILSYSIVKITISFIVKTASGG